MKKLFLTLIMLTVSLVSMGQNECVVNMEKSGKLGSVVNKKEIPNITKLTIKGGSGIELNEKDWKIIQKMTSLETLDITGISKRISYIPMNDKIGGKVIPNVKHLIVFEGEITPAYHESKENQYKRDMNEFRDIATDCNLLKWKFDYLGDIEYFPDLETIEIKNNVRRNFSISIPEIMYASNYNYKWRGGIKKDGTLFIERKDVAKNFKGYHIITEDIIEKGHLEGDLSQAIYINTEEKYISNIHSFTIHPWLRYIEHLKTYPPMQKITVEDGTDLLYIAGLGVPEIEFNRPVYINDLHADTVIFNKDVEYLYSLSAKNIVFKKIPKKIYKYESGGNSVSCQNGTIEIPAGSDKFFVDNGFPIKQLYYAKEESEKQRIQDSLDVAEGKKLMPYRWLLDKCVEYTEFSKDDHCPDFSNPFWKKFAAMCENDQLSYFKKDDLDELDKALYKKSDNFQEDKTEFEEKCKGTYGLFVPFEEKNIKFTADGFNFFVGGTGQLMRDDPASINYLKFPHFQFPIKKGVWVHNNKKDYGRYVFACNDVEKLKQIRECGKSLSLLLLFKPLTFTKVWIDYYIANPVGLYIVNHTSGEILLDLSASIRKTSLQQEKPIITSWQNFEKAQEERNKPKYHKQAKQVRCMFCGGQGYINGQPERINGVWTTPTHRCTICYGKGYTMEHYY